MRIGWTLPQHGAVAGPESLIRFSKRAEDLGVDSLWVCERLLWPVSPKAPYPASADGSLPVQFQRELDPLETLTFVAAHTQRARLGTSVINLPYYNPVMLARRIASRSRPTGPLCSTRQALTPPWVRWLHCSRGI